MKKNAEVIVVLSILLSGAGARAIPPRLHNDAARARRVWERTHGFSAHPAPDAGSTGGNPDSGSVFDGQSFWWIGSTSPASSIPNTGVQTILQEVDAPPDAGTGCFDCWTSEYLDNNTWGQIGWSACTFPGTPRFISTFYQVWSLEPEALLLDGESTVTSPGIHTYAMNVLQGTTWGYSVDGNLLGVYDMGSASSTLPEALSTTCEEGDGVLAPFVPPSVSAPVVMSVLDGGSWAGITNGELVDTAGLSGVAGHLQNSSLANDAMTVGGGDSDDSEGTPLWSGGPTPGFAPDAGPAGAGALAPPLVTLNFPAPNAVLSGTVTLSASVTLPPGAAAFGGFVFFLSDSFGATVASWSPTNASSPYTADWDTTQTPNGPYYFYAEEQDINGNTTFVDIALSVANSAMPTTSTATAATTTASGSAGASTATASSGTATGSTSSGTTGSSGASATASTSTSTSAATTTASAVAATGTTTGAPIGTTTGQTATGAGGTTSSGTTGAAATVTSSGGGSGSSGGCATGGAGLSGQAVLLVALMIGRKRRRRPAAPPSDLS